ncbi:hypothetical protein AAFF_G00440640 [Aldrovandia affinis]|uniref:RING-type E3 ubiquitin transferase n=1 Tax=Aldrovandia affinis TaxID=143900 RepID=A0AAD7WHW0_9TELE|nr:hypothetical protein AAFF_G00440640 [Aldrovandia affinis]
MARAYRGEHCSRPQLCLIPRDHNGSFGFSIIPIQGEKGRYSVSTVSGGPAERAGLRTGQSLVWINGAMVSKLTHTVLNKMLKKSVDHVTVLVIDSESEKSYARRQLPILPSMAGAHNLPLPEDLHLVRGPEGFGFLLRQEKMPSGCIAHLLREVDRDSPAEQAGMQDGDLLLAVNSETVEMLEHDDIVSRIRLSDQQVTLTIIHVNGRDLYMKLCLSPLLFYDNKLPKEAQKNPKVALTAPPVELPEELQLTPPCPRLCVLVKKPTGFGFRLGSVHHKHGTFIAQVEIGGSGEKAGLWDGDVVVEVNGQNVEEQHLEDVATLMMEGGCHLRLLVVDRRGYERLKHNGVPITPELVLNNTQVEESKYDYFVNYEDISCKERNIITLNIQTWTDIYLSLLKTYATRQVGSGCGWRNCPGEMTDQGNNNQNISRNPFAALFSSLADAKQFASGQKQHQRPDPPSDASGDSQSDSENSVSDSIDDNDDSVAEISRSFRSRQELCEQLNVNHMIQRIFLITLDNSDPSLKGGNGTPPRCVYLEEMAADLDGQDWLDMDNIEQALFNRLLLLEPGSHLMYMTSSSVVNLPADRHAGEKCAMPYLYACYQRAKEEVTKVPEKLLSFAVRCKNLTVSNARTVLLTPEIYVSQNIYEQLLDLLLEGVSGAQLDEVVEFVDEVIAALLADQEVRTFGEVIVPVLDILHGRVKDLDLCQLLLYSYLDILLYFSHQKDIAKMLMEYIQPKDPNSGLQYQKTLLGAVLSVSCLLKTPGVVESHGFFVNPSRSSPQEMKVQESNIHQFMGQYHEKLYQVLRNLLQQSGDTRHLLLSWLGGCLQANAGRAKIWANQMPEIFMQTYASDALFLNLGAALLKLCQPFCRPRSPKLLTFNPTYCALKELSEEERRNRNVHVRGLDKETCLTPAPPQQTPEYAHSYSLLTENLILTQLTLHLGFHRLHDQMVKMNQSLHRLQGSWRRRDTGGARPQSSCVSSLSVS